MNPVLLNQKEWEQGHGARFNFVEKSAAHYDNALTGKYQEADAGVSFYLSWGEEKGLPAWWEQQ